MHVVPRVVNVKGVGLGKLFYEPIHAFENSNTARIAWNRSFSKRWAILLGILSMHPHIICYTRGPELKKLPKHSSKAHHGSIKGADILRNLFRQRIEIADF